jgi:hypothetical protein
MVGHHGGVQGLSQSGIYGVQLPKSPWIGEAKVDKWRLVQAKETNGGYF